MDYKTHKGISVKQRIQYNDRTGTIHDKKNRSSNNELGTIARPIVHIHDKYTKTETEQNRPICRRHGIAE